MEILKSPLSGNDSIGLLLVRFEVTCSGVRPLVVLTIFRSFWDTLPLVFNIPHTSDKKLYKNVRRTMSAGGRHHRYG